MVINSLRLFKSFAPRFFANSSSILVSVGSFTFNILQLNIASLFINSLTLKFSGSFTLTFLSSFFLVPINCSSKPFMNKSLPKTSCVFFPELPLKSFPSTVAS